MPKHKEATAEDVLEPMAEEHPAVEDSSEPVPVEEPPKAAAPVPEKIEDLAKRLETQDWVMAALKVRHKWGIGQLVTEAKFKEAVKGFLEMPLGVPAAAKPETKGT